MRFHLLILLGFAAFTAESQTNVALYRPTLVDSNYRAPENIGLYAVDGDKTPGNNASRWVSADGYPHYFEVSLDQAYSIDEVRFYTGYNGYSHPVSSYQIQYWDGTDWQNAFIKTGNTSPEVIETFPAIETDRIRLYATEGSDGILRLYEFEVYGVPSTTGPEPDTGDYWNTGGETLLSGDVSIRPAADTTATISITDVDQVNISSKESISLTSQSEGSSPLKLEITTAGLTVESSESVTTTMNTTGDWDYQDHNLTNIRNLQVTNLAIGEVPIPEGYSLAIDGKAIVEGVNIKLVENWPDYVFEDDYQLKSLEEVQTYITAHKHLPEVPTAAEVEKEGLSVAEINATLLKKIEELTLYLIAQDQRIKKLEEKNEASEGVE